MIEQTISILVAVVIGGGLTLLGVAIGGHFVFKTKREAHESLFKFKPLEGDAEVIDDDFPQPDNLRSDLPDIEDDPVLPDTILAQRERFDKADQALVEKSEQLEESPRV